MVGVAATGWEGAGAPDAVPRSGAALTMYGLIRQRSGNRTLHLEAKLRRTARAASRMTWERPNSAADHEPGALPRLRIRRTCASVIAIITADAI
jgi:hypothetical protein